MTATSKITIKQIAYALNVSERGIYQCLELQRCRPDLGERVGSGELTVAAALQLAKPEKYRKPDKVQKWLNAFRAWNAADRARAIVALADELEARR